MADCKKWILSALVALMLVLIGCAGSTTGTTTPAAPANPPNVTVLGYIQLGSTLDNTAAHALLVLCTTQPGATAPVLDSGTCAQVSTYLQAAVAFFEAAKSEASSTDTWAVMKVKIAALAATVATNTAISDPTLKQEIAGLQSIVTQILGVQ
ncbi:MAG: hypothetical protein ABR880_24640 [Candidatus Sulfotelmatobacter sp.]|jgi:hypothetical protein